MESRDEFRALVAILKAERDNANLKAHLVTMESQKELEEAEARWSNLEDKLSEITDGFVNPSEEYIARVTIISKELTETYKRLSERLSE